MRWTRRLAIPLLAIIAFCNTCTGPAPLGPALMAPVALTLPEEFRPSLSIMRGFDAPAPLSDWRVGDQVLLGLRVQLPEGQNVWFVRVQVLADSVQPGQLLQVPWGDGPPVEMVAPQRGLKRTIDGQDVEPIENYLALAVHLYNDQARPQTVSFCFAPEIFLRGGLITTAAGGVAPATSDELLRQRMVRFFHVLNSSRNLRPIMSSVARDVARTPPIPMLLLQRLMRGYTLVEFRTLQDQGQFVPAIESAAFGAQVPRHVPMEVEIEKNVVLQGAITVVPADPPLHLCGGIIGLEGVHPNDPSRRFELRLLASRRGRPHLQQAHLERSIPSAQALAATGDFTRNPGRESN